jgi:uncharacterized protein involved in type VI secretion and phage assembly
MMQTAKPLPGGAAARYLGKYRGTVVSALDPLQKGRIIALVPDVLGPVPSSWALPCVPFAGKQMGSFALPQPGAGVWIEFEQGNPNYPIWVGCFFADGDVPVLALAGPPVAPNVVIQTQGQNTLVLSDTPGPTGGIMLKSATGVTLIVNDTGIYLQNGKGAMVTLIGPTVAINNGALAVT